MDTKPLWFTLIGQGNLGQLRGELERKAFDVDAVVPLFVEESGEELTLRKTELVDLLTDADVAGDFQLISM